MSTIRNYTTKIKVEKTIMEIEQILTKFGAIGIMKQFDQGRINSLFFQIETQHGKVSFRLPAEVEKVRLFLSKSRSNGSLKSITRKQANSLEHARRVAWRNIKDWIDAQLSIIEVGMVKVEQIFLPYMFDPASQTTLFEKFESGNLLLEGGP